MRIGRLRSPFSFVFCRVFWRDGEGRVSVGSGVCVGCVLRGLGGVLTRLEGWGGTILCVGLFLCLD